LFWDDPLFLRVFTRISISTLLFLFNDILKLTKMLWKLSPFIERKDICYHDVCSWTNSHTVARISLSCLNVSKEIASFSKIIFCILWFSETCRGTLYIVCVSENNKSSCNCLVYWTFGLTAHVYRLSKNDLIGFRKERTVLSDLRKLGRTQASFEILHRFRSLLLWLLLFCAIKLIRLCSVWSHSALI